MRTQTVELLVLGRQDKPLEMLLRRLLRFLQIRHGFWTIKVVGDAEMSALHLRTLGLSDTTDVLTFDLREKEEGRRKRPEDYEGCAVALDTVICLDEARRRAGELGHTVHKELLLYCVHSLLHVQGYDDVTAAGARRMHAREDEILVALGIGPVYRGKKPDGKSKIKNQKSKIPEAS